MNDELSVSLVQPFKQVTSDAGVSHMTMRGLWEFFNSSFNSNKPFGQVGIANLALLFSHIFTWQSKSCAEPVRHSSADYQLSV